MKIVKDDIDLKFLAGLPVMVEKIGYFYAPTMKQIAEMGESEYRSSVSCFLTNQDALKDVDLGFEIEDLNDYKAILIFFFISEDFRRLFSEGVQLFFKETLNVSREHGLFYLGEIEDGKVIDEDKMKQIKNLILKCNHLKDEKPEKEEYNPANEQARKLIEKIQKAKQNAPKKKDSALFNYVSGLAWKAHAVNIFNVFDLNIYQLYDALGAIDRIDNYNFTLTGVYTGNISSKDVKMSDIHWTSIKK